MGSLEKKQSVFWTRLAPALIAIAALYYVFQKVNPQELRAVFSNVRWVWLFAAILVYGIAFPASAWRWHLMLRLTGNAVHFTATFIMSLIGHFFYTVFLGVAGGDLAKSALYARWYQLPLPEILAAAPLDRLLGFGGVLIFTILAFILAALNGAFLRLQFGVPHFSLGWIVVILLSALLIGFIIKKRGRLPAATQWLDATRRSVQQLRASKSIICQAVICGFFVQLALAGGLALCMQAVSQKSLNWGPLLWTLPVITIISAVPFTVAGLGLREGAALTLLGLYGVSPADAVAASLLTLVVRLAWAVIGGLLLWREKRFQERKLPLPKTISVVIPTRNEAQAMAETIQRVQKIPEVSEIIVVDGGSEDGTREIAAELGCKVYQCAPGRGGQMQLGISNATGDVVLLLHADAWLSTDAGKAIINCLRDMHVVAGSFWKSTRESKQTSPYSLFNYVVWFFLSNRNLGDKAMFIRHEALERIGGVSAMPIEEEFELCRQLRKIGRLALAEGTVFFSTRRFRKETPSALTC